MFPQQQFPGQGLSSPGAPRVPPGSPGNNPVNRPISSSSTPPPGPPFGAPGRPPISHPTKRFLPPVEQRKRDVACIADLAPLTENDYHDYDADDESDDSSDLGAIEGKPQSVWSNSNSPWSNLPKRWGRPTIVHSTSGRNYGWLGFSRKSIGPISGGRSDWNSLEMDPCTGRQPLQIVWRHLRAGCRRIMSIMLKRFIGSGWSGFWRNVEAKLERRGKRDSEATCDQRQIWESTRAKRWEVTIQSCQIHHPWFWFTRCPMATITFYPQPNSKPCIPMWGTGRSQLNSMTKTDAWRSHTL